MKTFIDHTLISEDKSRFIKKNKNLSRAQKDIIIDFFAEYEQAVKRNHKTKVDWNKSGNMTWEDFEKIMSITRSTPSFMKAKARKLRHKGVAGLKEGEDYVYVKTKNKGFLCYIPLNYRANQVIFSSNIGGVQHDGCIGSSSAKQYYTSEAVKKGLVPVVVVGASKDTVMVKRDNKSWELWDSCNNRHSNGSAPFVNKELIPDFSIKKELMTKKLGELYDWVRTEIWGGSAGGAYSEEEYDDAVEAYDELASDIDRYISDYDEAEEYGRNEVSRIIDNTIEKYRDDAEEIMSDFEADYGKAVTGMDGKEVLASKRVMDRIKAIKTAVELRPHGTDVNDKGEQVWHLSGVEGKAVHNKRNVLQVGRKPERLKDIRQMELGGSNLVAYTKPELDAFLDYAEKNYVKTPDEDRAMANAEAAEWEERREEAEAQAAGSMAIVSNLEKLVADGEWYEVYDENRGSDNDWLDEIEWTDYIPSGEYEWTDEVYAPHSGSSSYAPYFDFNEQHGNGVSVNDDYSLEESIREAVYDGGQSDGATILVDNDYYHPSDIVENMNEED